MANRYENAEIGVKEGAKTRRPCERAPHSQQANTILGASREHVSTTCEAIKMPGQDTGIPPISILVDLGGCG